MRLDRFSSAGFDRGAPRWREAVWVMLNGALFSSWLPGSGWRRVLLTVFGARIGRYVVVKPGVRVKFPWRLSVGDHSWIGEDVWIDNLAQVTIGAHACISQGAYLCTGNHDWRKETFDLIARPITINDHAWVAARASLAPGSVMEEGAVLAMSSLGQGRLERWTIHAGCPATPLRSRPRDDG
jgi:putative colanic acid biosynthesis acetyltransferase WcaF